MAQLETFLDVLLIEEIPVEDAKSLDVIGLDGKPIETTEKTAQKPFLGKVVSCDKRFPMAGQWVDMPYRVGDIVYTNDFGRDYLRLDPFRDWKLIKKDDTKYYTIPYQDVFGLVERAAPAASPKTQCYRRILNPEDVGYLQCSYGEGHEKYCKCDFSVPVRPDAS